MKPGTHHDMETAVIAITRNGIGIGSRLLSEFPEWDVLAPAKLRDGTPGITWYEEPTPRMVGEAFKRYDALVCVFSLGAVIRLVSPHLVDKKTDPAVMVIDDRAGFVISALSGHIGGANELARQVAARLGATPVITTAADVNDTIAVDLVGRDLGWSIEEGCPVTSVSAHMVNGDPIGIWQDAGSRAWRAKMPPNVTIYKTLEELDGSGSSACLVITDRIVSPAIESVVYRPPSLVVGVGVHGDTPADKITSKIAEVLEGHGLSPRSISAIASIKKPAEVRGLAEAAGRLDVDLVHVDRERLAEVRAPNPSDTVMAYEGTASVSEAAAILVSGGGLVVEKQKFPPDLTVAVARIPGDAA